MATEHKNKPDAIWQVVQERVGFSGKVVARQKLGIPRSLENAKQIINYRNTIEIRSDTRYRIERIDD